MNRNTLQAVLLVLFVVVMAFSISGCHDPDDMAPPTGKKLIINHAREGDNRRMQVPEQEELVPLMEISSEHSGARISTDPPEDLNYVLMLRAEVDAPQWQDQTLQASHVVVANSLAYVTYNTQGASYRGGLDIIDVSNPRLPSLKTQAIFTNAEFSSVAVDDQHVYLAGAREDEENLQSPAILEIFAIEDDGLSPDSRVIDLPSYVGTDVKIDDQYIYVTYGSNGGLSVYDKGTLESVKMIELDDARSIMLWENQIIIMQGTPARITVIEKGSWSTLQSFSMAGANNLGAKSIFALSDDALFVPCGHEGLKIIKRNTGSSLYHQPLPELEGIDTEDISSNGVSVTHDKIFVANGAVGLYVLHYSNDSYHLFGSANFAGSVNYVMSQENLMFVATGTGGLKIIEIVEYNPEEGDYLTGGGWDEYGKPDYLCESESAIDATLDERIKAHFIKGDDLTLRQPDWFNGAMVTDIPLREATDIEITVVSETTHHKNTFGYYSYDPENTPGTPEDLSDMTVVFPNATVTSSGSHLMKGDKVCYSGFKANSNLGFFLIYKGFVEGSVTNGFRTHYSSQWLNKNRSVKQQHVLLADPDQQVLVLAFEDIQRPYHDQDFDDGIFLVTFSNPNAVDWSAFLKLPK